MRVPTSGFVADVERIAFAVRFLQTDLDALTGSGWADLREQFQRMRWPSGSASRGVRRGGRAELVVPHAAWEDPERELPERVIRKLQRETEQLVVDIVDAHDAAQRKPFIPPTSHQLVFHAVPLVFGDRVVRQVKSRPGLSLQLRREEAPSTPTSHHDEGFRLRTTR